MSALASGVIRAEDITFSPILPRTGIAQSKVLWNGYQLSAAVLSCSLSRGRFKIRKAGEARSGMTRLVLSAVKAS
jgi:hypothetical protein